MSTAAKAAAALWCCLLSHRADLLVDMFADRPTQMPVLPQKMMLLHKMDEIYKTNGIRFELGKLDK